MDVSPNRIPVNGVELAYIEQGTGDPVVLVHGSLGDLRSWPGQMEALASRHRVLAVSRRHHWPNDLPGDGARYAAADHVADLAAFIDALGIAPAHLVGSSYGAMTCLALAVRRSGYARSLVLGEPPLLPWLDRSPGGAELRDAFLADAWSAATDAAERGDAEAMVRSFIDGVIGPGTFERLPLPARAGMLDNAPEMAVELRMPPETYFPSLTCEDVGRVDAPVLLLDGEVSPRMFRLVQDGLASCLPSIERVTIPSASHGMHMGNPQAYNEIVFDFLDRH